MSVCSICNDNKWLLTQDDQTVPCECLRSKWVEAWIKSAGVPVRYASASLDLVYPGLRRVLPEPWHRLVVGGDLQGYRKVSFGISSHLNCGKSSAVGLYLVSIFRALAQHQIRPDTPGYRHVWSNWQFEYEWFQQNCINTDELNRRHRAFSDACLVVLDGLGREPEKHDSFASKQLTQIITTRFINAKPTIFTTSLDYEQLKARYGPSLVEKLLNGSELCTFEED